MSTIASNGVTDLEALYFQVGVLLQEHGNMPVSISVFQEHPADGPYGGHREERSCSHIDVVKDHGEILAMLVV
jgi:hypothetical protein